MPEPTHVCGRRVWFRSRGGLTRARSGTGDEAQVTVESRVACRRCVRPVRVDSSRGVRLMRSRVRLSLIVLEKQAASEERSSLSLWCRARTRPGSVARQYIDRPTYLANGPTPTDPIISAPSSKSKSSSDPIRSDHGHRLTVPRPLRPKRQTHS